MRRVLLALPFVIALVGCAPMKPVPISPEIGQTLPGHSVVVALHDKSDQAGFLAMTSGDGMLGMIGALSAIDRGSKHYGADARLIDTRTALVLGEARCSYSPPSSDHNAKWEDLVNNQAAGMKIELAKATTACVADLEKGLMP